MSRQFSSWAANTRVSLRALRFYEDRGLLQPRRRHRASRYYAPSGRRRLRIILKGKQLGFTLTKIRALVKEKRDDTSDIHKRLNAQQVADQIGLFERQRNEIETAIACRRAAERRRSLGEVLAAP
jgi:DNA-binding transcriptional MerR regulator